MTIITIYSAEALDTLDRGYTSSPIDMPESETTDKNEYVVQVSVFEQAFKNWNRNDHPVMEVKDDLTGQPIWLSQHQAEQVDRAIHDGKESVDL